MTPLLKHIKDSNLAVAYARVSTPQQATKNSIECQEKTIQAYADHNNLGLLWFKDVGSAFKRPLSKRPQAMAALEKARELGVPLIVDTPDRLARNDAGFCELIEEYGVRIIAAEIGELAPGVLKACVARAKAESERNSDGVKKAYARRGGRPFNPNMPSAQKKAVAKVSERALDRARELDSLVVAHGLGDLKPHKMAKTLNELNLLRSDGKAWTPGGVAYSRKLISAPVEPPLQDEAPVLYRNPPILVSAEEEDEELEQLAKELDPKFGIF